MSFLVVDIGIGVLAIAVILSSFRSSRDGQFCNPNKLGWHH